VPCPVTQPAAPPGTESISSSTASRRPAARRAGPGCAARARRPPAARPTASACSARYAGSRPGCRRGDPDRAQQRADDDAGAALAGGAVHQDRAGCGGHQPDDPSDLRGRVPGQVPIGEGQVGIVGLRGGQGRGQAGAQRDLVHRGHPGQRVRPQRLGRGAQVDDRGRRPDRHVGTACRADQRHLSAVQHGPADDAAVVGAQATDVAQVRRRGRGARAGEVVTSARVLGGDERHATS